MVVLSGVLTKILGTALGRLGTVGLQKALRLKQVESAIRGGKPVDAAVQTALADFELVIGSRYGELTEELDRFLRELERTGLVTALAEEAALHKPTPGTKNAFLHLHDAVIGAGHGDGIVLYQRFTSAFAASLRVLTKDAALAFLIKSTGRDLEARIQNVGEKLDILLRSLTSKTSYDALAATMQRIAKALTSQFRDARVETNRGAKLIDISRIYIPSKMRCRKNPVSQEMARELIVQPPQLGSRRHRLRMRSKGKYEFILGSAESPENISYVDFKNGFRKVVILGDPGGGKSTLCQYLCYELSKQSSLQLQHPENSNFEASLQKIPIRVVLRSFERARITKPQLSIFEFILEELKGIVSAASEEVEDCLRYILTYGRAVLAFDGLDEILITARRREFVQLVTVFCEQYPLCPVLITSRIVGYEEAPLTDDFEEMLIEKFNDDEIGAYLQKFLRVVSSHTKADAEKKAKIFMKQTERNARDLRQNPLLLGLMAFLFAMKNDVPSNRPEIYRECAILMFEKWDQNREISANIPIGFDMLHLFSILAAEIYGKTEFEEGVSAKWIEEHNRRYFNDFYESKAKAIEAAKLVTKFITGRSWVMSEFAPDTYRFTHRTFLEYFFARFIEEKYETIANLIPILRPKVAKKQWDVISHLALQLKTYRNQKRIGQTLDQLDKLISEAGASDKFLDAVLSFASHALEYLPGTEQDLKRVVSNITNKSLSLAERDIGALRPIVECCNCAPERQDYVAGVVADMISMTIKRGGSVAHILGGLVLLSDTGVGRWVSSDLDVRLPRPVVEQIKSYIQEALLQHAVQTPTFALIYWSLFHNQFSNLYSKHGLKMFSADEGFSRVATNVEPLFEVLIKTYEPMRFALKDQQYRTQKAALATLGRSTITAEILAEVLPLLHGRVFVPDEMWQDIFRKMSGESELFRGAVLVFVIESARQRLIRSGPISRHLAAKRIERGNHTPFSERLRKIIEAEIRHQIEKHNGDYAFYDEWVKNGYRLQKIEISNHRTTNQMP
jgi:hypothetical protein